MTAPGPALRDLCERLRVRMPGILVDWQEIVREEAGRALPRDCSLTALAELVLGLVEASLCAPADTEAQRERVRAAAEHGVALRRQGLSDALIFTEYHLLRRAIWHHVQRLEPDTEMAIQLIARVDQAITVATAASMYGYAGPEGGSAELPPAWVDQLVARGCP